MDIVELRTFVVVAEELHFGRAAERLSYTKSHVSQITLKLEREFGMALFARNTRQVSLTPEGTELLAYARAVIEAVIKLEDAATRLAKTVTNEFRLACSPATGAVTAQLTRKLLAKEPSSHIRVDPSTDSMKVLQAVASGEARAGLAHWRSDALNGLCVATSPIDLVVWPEHRLAGRPMVGVRDLDGELVLVANRQQNPEFYEATTQYYRMHGGAPTLCERHIPSQLQLYDLVASRQGVAVLPHEDRNISGVVRIPYAEPIPPGLADVYLVWRKGSSDRLLTMLISTAQELAASLTRPPTPV